MDHAYKILPDDISSFRFTVVYRASSCVLSNIEQLLKSLSDLDTCVLNSVIVGDFNMP